ncbi:hypothetical protein BDF22DRAFT_746520 [Syncephalis plumigaleata]|nr:hypothetical protein BDF22DRAFT_746520 [Syncephalis plumigaleata]
MTQSLKYLRVRPRKIIQGSPCVTEMVAMLNCWGISAADDPKCAQTAKALATCMQNLPKKSKKTTTINYHLARLGKLL